MTDNSSLSMRSAFVPVLLVGCAVLVWMGFQTAQLISERRQLDEAHNSQAQPLEQSQKLRASLDSIAAATQKLADSGDAGAKLLVDELNKRGITINPNAASQPSPR
jgi:hypothetical protein